MLFVLNKSFAAAKLETYLLRIGRKGTVLLIEDAVYAVKSNSQSASVIASHLPDITVYAIAPDLMLRGINEKEILDGVILVEGRRGHHDIPDFRKVICAMGRSRHYK